MSLLPFGVNVGQFGVNVGQFGVNVGSSVSTLVERGGALSPLPLPTPASLATSLTLPPSSPLH
jgi:hypothetical protein